MDDLQSTRDTDTDPHELAYFLRVANESCLEAKTAHAQPLSFLARIDHLYMDFLDAAGGIKPAAAAVLLLNAHASFRAAIRLALSGQLLPAFMTLRGSIESALYAHGMVAKPELQEVWLNRHKDEESRQNCRRAFSAGKVFQYLKQAHEEEFTDRMRDMYDSTIDFGAHPNSRSLLNSIRIEETDDGEHAMSFAYIHGTDSFELQQSLVACAEVGLGVFFVTLLCFEDHPRIEELNEIALELQDAVPSFIEDFGFSVKDGSMA